MGERLERTSATVESQKQQLSSLTSQMSSANSGINSLTSRMSTAESRVSTARSQISSLRSAGYLRHCRVCFRETRGSSQCKLNRNSCSGWASVSTRYPAWTLEYLDDTDNGVDGCVYQWRVECVWKKKRCCKWERWGTCTQCWERSLVKWFEITILNQMILNHSQHCLYLSTF